MTVVQSPDALSNVMGGFRRPWNHLEQLIEDVHIREVGLGSGYIVTGRAPR